MPLIHPSFRFLLLAAALFLFCCLLSNSNHRLLLQWRIRDQVDNLLDQAASDLVRSLQANNHSISISEELFILEIKDVQNSLARYVQQGSWSGQTFNPNLSDGRRWGAPVLNLCSMLRTKKVLLVGPETTFHLHTLWLHSLSGEFNTSSKCVGADFCTFHHICVNGAIESALRTPRARKPPTLRELSTYGSSILRFVLSTTLYPSSDPRDRFYTAPIVDTQTHIRVKNAIWMNHARNSDVIVMNRGPLPAPAWTYSSGLEGNWTFVDDLYATPSAQHLALGDGHSLISRTYHQRYQRAIRIINAALHATLTVFLPGTMETLTAIQKSATIREKILVWHGSWYLNPICTGHDSPEGFSIDPQLLSPYDDNDSLTLDPWSLYYNAQVYMHDRLLPSILPHFGVVYLPLTIPLAPANITYKGTKDTQKGMFGEARKDCLRYLPGEPEGKALGTAFLGGLVRLLEQIQ